MIQIQFYNVDEPYGCFSNFSKYPIELDGKVWTTTEHYFQAMKFENTEYEEEIRLLSSPMAAATSGRDRNKPIRKDWEEVKDYVMRKAIRTKCEQHDEFRNILLSTGDCVLVEHTKNDSYWGDGGDGSGLNRLGKILMEVRNNLPSYDGIFYPPVELIGDKAEKNVELYLKEQQNWLAGLSVAAKREYYLYFNNGNSRR